MNKLPFDIVSLPLVGIIKKPIGITHRTSGTEVEIFKQVQQGVNNAIEERAVFDYRKPRSNVFEATDVVQGGDHNEKVLKSRRRPVFYGMTGYLLPPYFHS